MYVCARTPWGSRVKINLYETSIRVNARTMSCPCVRDRRLCGGCEEKHAGIDCDVDEHEVAHGKFKAFVDCWTVPKHHWKLLPLEVQQSMRECGHMCMVFSKQPEQVREQRIRAVLARQDLSCRIYATLPLARHDEPVGCRCHNDWMHLLEYMDFKIHEHDYYDVFRCVAILNTPTSVVSYEQYAGVSMKDLMYTRRVSADDICCYLKATVTFIQEFESCWNTTADLHSDINVGNLAIEKVGAHAKIRVLDPDYLCRSNPKFANILSTHAHLDDIALLLCLFSSFRHVNIEAVLLKFARYPMCLVVFIVLCVDDSLGRLEAFRALVLEHNRMTKDEFKWYKRIFTDTYHTDARTHAHEYVSRMHAEYHGNLFFFIDNYTTAISIGRFIHNMLNKDVFTLEHKQRSKNDVSFIHDYIKRACKFIV